MPDNHQTFSNTLAQAVEDVFALWELPPPAPMQGWENPAQNESAWKTGQTGPIPQVLKKDPATNQIWRLNPLEWNGIDVYSLLYIAFPSRILLAQALGTTSITGRWSFGAPARQDSEVWYQAITGVRISITAPATDGMTTAWHELAHWMVYVVCERDSVAFGQLPSFLIEGIAEYTKVRLVGLTGREEYAVDWARDNALAVEMDNSNTYRIGLSLVAYLVETQSASGFLSSLSLWAEDPANQIILIENGWHQWLGLE